MIGLKPHRESTRMTKESPYLRAQEVIPGARSTDRTARLKGSGVLIGANGMRNPHRNTKGSFSRIFGMKLQSVHEQTEAPLPSGNGASPINQSGYLSGVNGTKPTRDQRKRP